MIKPDYFELIFRNWVKRVCLEVKGVVAIDGKLMRGPSQCDGEHTTGKEGFKLWMVSAWSAANGISLGQVKVDDKSNEITAIPLLINSLELSGCIVTIDAMGCEKDITCLCSILLTAIIFGIGFGRIASSDIEIMKGCIFAALLLWGSSVPLYLWQLILAFQFGKGVSIGAGIISGLISALMLTGLGDYVWKYVFVCWTGRVPYTYLQSVLGETSVGEWLSFIPGCLIFTGLSVVYYFWWVNHWEGNRISE